MDRFEILLYQYRLKFGTDGLEKLLCRCNPRHHDHQGKEMFDIAAQDINALFFRESEQPDYLDKLGILTQRIFEESLGCGCVDLLWDMRLSVLMAGAAPGESKISVWVDIEDRTFRLSFLQMEAEELEKICRRIIKLSLIHIFPCDSSDKALGPLRDTASVYQHYSYNGRFWNDYKTGSERIRRI